MTINLAGQPQYIQDLLDWDTYEQISWLGHEWGEADSTTYSEGFEITYSFDISNYDSGPYAYHAFDATQQAAALLAMSYYENISNIVFVESDDNPDIAFASGTGMPSNLGGVAYNTFFTSTDLLIDSDIIVKDTLTYGAGEQGSGTMVHEIGHGLGLSHPGYDAENENYDNDATIMSYNRGGYTFGYDPDHPMLFDIATIQFLYGANTDYNSDDTTYILGDEVKVETIWDGGGNDTISAEALWADLYLDLREGFDPEGSQYANYAGNETMMIAYGANIENIIGGNGNDTINGNALDNSVEGGAGNDVLYGNEGADRLVGGSGNNTLYGGDGADAIYVMSGTNTIDGGSGTDFLYYIQATSSVTIDGRNGTTTGAATDDFSNIEGFVATDFDDTITGGYGNDSIFSGNGDDLVYGSIGYDALNGGYGNDMLSYSRYNGYLRVDMRSDVGLASATSRSTGKLAAGVNFTDTFEGFEQIRTGSYSDTVYGGTRSETIKTGSGNDIVYEMGGTNTLDGGSGYDILSYIKANSSVVVDIANSTTSGASTDTYTGFERFRGSQYDDIFNVDGGSYRVQGGDGDDVFFSRLGSNDLHGDEGTDMLSYLNATGSVYLDSRYGYSLYAATDSFSGFEIFRGSEFDDTLFSSTADQTFYGGDGDDLIYGLAGTNTFDGGDGTEDMLTYYRSSGSVTIDARFGTTTGASTDTLENFEEYRASEFDDVIKGSSRDEKLVGGGGNDVIYEQAGTNDLRGGSGIDTLSYINARSAVNINIRNANTSGATNDTFSEFEKYRGSQYDDTIKGSSSSETIKGGRGYDVIYEQGGTNWLDGGDGIDVLSYFYAATNVIMNIENGTTSGASTDSFYNFEKYRGSQYDDTIFGSTADEEIIGGGGDDTIYGRGGADTLYGHDGLDSLFGEAGSDLLYGGNDRDTLRGGDGDDILYGGEGNDLLYGDGDDDTLYGDNGNDLLSGGDGHDTLRGGAGNDTLYGLDDEDTLYGGVGQNSLYGGQGADIFVFLTDARDGQYDIIEDFDQGSDVINLVAFGFSSINDLTITDIGTHMSITEGENFEIRVFGDYTLVESDFDFA